MSNPEKKKLNLRKRRAHRIRARIFGTAEKPRLTVFRSNQHLYAQLIDDRARTTLCAVSSKAFVKDKKSPLKGMALAKALGAALAYTAKEKKIATVVFDRGAYRYHGLVKAIAEGAREGGLKF